MEHEHIREANGAGRHGLQMSTVFKRQEPKNAMLLDAASQSRPVRPHRNSHAPQFAAMDPA
jgi:hypothetical protein